MIGHHTPTHTLTHTQTKWDLGGDVYTQESNGVSFFDKHTNVHTQDDTHADVITLHELLSNKENAYRVTCSHRPLTQWLTHRQFNLINET